MNHDQVEFFSWIIRIINIEKKVNIIYDITENGKNPHDYFNCCRKNIKQNSTYFHDKNTQQAMKRKKLPQHNKSHI